MDPEREREDASHDEQNERDRQALATLERSARSGGLLGIWHRLRFRLLAIWNDRLAIITGLLISLAALVVIWQEMSSDVTIAVAVELVLAGGVLLFAHGLGRWWRTRWSRPR